MFSALSVSSSLTNYNKPIIPLSSPLSIDGCTLWLDQDSFYTDTACTSTNACSIDGQIIKGWKDKSTSANNFTNTYPVTGPLYKPNSINTTKSSILFNQTHGLYARDSLLLPSGSLQTSTTFIVVKASNASNNNAGLGILSWGNRNDRWRAIQTDVAGANVKLTIVGAGDVINSNVNIGGFIHQLAFVTGTNKYGYLDNAAFINNGSTAPFGNSANNFAVVGSTITAPSYLSAAFAGGTFVGNMCEIIIYDTELNSTDRTSVYNYLKTKYGTP